MIHVILLAAGKSQRLDSNIKKQFINHNNRPLYMNSLETFLNIDRVDDIILVISKEDENSEYIKFLYDSDIYKIHKNKINITFGGLERYDSVRNSFIYIEENLKYNDEDKILIHDSARPFVNTNDIIKEIDALDKYNAVGLASKCVDTVKKISDNQNGDILKIEKTLDRDLLYLIYTPQGFKYKTIKYAYDEFYKILDNNKNIKITDDLQIVELFTKENTYLIDSDRQNIKITTKEDLKYIN